MKLFSVIYFKGKLIAAMFLWQGATVQDCQTINREYQKSLMYSPLIMSGEAKITDLRLTCEWHKQNPVKNGVRL